MDNVEIEAFPTLLDFHGSADDIVEKAIPWRDLPVGAVYRILSRRTVTANERPSMILTLKGADNSTRDVWATSLILGRLQEEGAVSSDRKVFIVSTGQKESKNKRTYYGFKILYR